MPLLLRVSDYAASADMAFVLGKSSTVGSGAVGYILIVAGSRLHNAPGTECSAVKSVCELAGNMCGGG